MTHTVLGGVSLGYQPVWNRLRELCGIRLFVSAEDTSVDALHLLNSINELWSAQSPTLILSVQSLPLLSDILMLPSQSNLWIEVSPSQLQDPVMLQRVHQAHHHGAKLVWRGESGSRPSAALAPCFLRNMLRLSTQDSRLSSPVLPDQIYESVASQELAEHCLDSQGVWGLVAWPIDDVLRSYQHQRIQPARRVIVNLMESIDADSSVEHIEQILSEDPILYYAFMRYANSASLSLRTDIESVRRALMVLGLSMLRAWLIEQLPQANSDLNLQPVRSTLVLRADLMVHLLDAGDSHELRREIHLCGLLSQIDLLLGEPLEAALARLPLPDRVSSAILKQSGPYAPYLEVATALELPDTQATRRLCLMHQLNLEEVNRAVLRTLSTARKHPAKGSLLA